MVNRWLREGVRVSSRHTEGKQMVRGGSKGTTITHASGCSRSQSLLLAESIKKSHENN